MNRQQEIAGEQAKQKLTNAAKLFAYATGCYNGGWLIECIGSIGGFPNDYSLVHGNPGNIILHNVTAVRLMPDDRHDGLMDLLEACGKEHNGKNPVVIEITEAEIDGAKQMLRTAFNSQYDQTCVHEWLAGLFEGGDENEPDMDKLAEEMMD